MRIVKRSVRFGFLGAYTRSTEESSFNWSVSSVVQGDYDDSNGNRKPSWLDTFRNAYPTQNSYLGIRPDYMSRWPQDSNKDSNKVEWNVLEDGTYVSKSLPSFRVGERVSVDLRGSKLYAKSGDFFFDTKVSIGGERYTVRPMRIGYRRGDGTYVVNAEAGDQDEYFKYILCSDDPTTQAWGNLTSIQRRSGSSPADYGTQLFRNYGELNDSGGWGPPPGDLALYVELDKKDVSRYFGKNNVTLRLIAIPDAYWATLAVKKSNLGKKTGAFSFDVTLGHKTDATVPEFTATVGGKAVVNEKAAKVGAKRIAIDKATFDGLPSGKNTVVIKAKNAAGHVTEASVAFTKVDAFVELRGKPAEHDDMPRKCAIVKSEVLGRGATSSWWVSNNAADAAPAWEQYAGGIHEFANKSKTAAKWAVAWKCSIGGAAATTRSELIKQVGMAIM